MMPTIRGLDRAMHELRTMLAIAATFPATVLAQVPETGLTTPAITATDANDVDLVSGYTKFSLADLSIGSTALPLAHTVMSIPNGFQNYYLLDNFHGGIGALNSNEAIFMKPTFSVDSGGVGERFYLDNGILVSAEAKGSTLVDNGGTYTYTRHDGVVFTIDKAFRGNVQSMLNGVVAYSG